MVFISACVIVKNEAQNLPSWLASVKAFADEMIVVDTGSTDNTKALAQAAGARVFDFKWINDFSAAKNFAIDQARGKWIAFPDADEYFDTASQKILRTLLRRLDARREIQGVTCPLHNIDVDDGNRLLSVVVQLRLFRNRPELRYQGDVHEMIPGIPPQCIYLARELGIIHTGYSSHCQREKSQRNLKMLLEGQQGRENPVDWHYIMDCYYGLSDYERAIVYAKKIIDAPALPVRDRKKAWETWASSCLKGGHAMKETLEALEGGLEEFPCFTRLRAMKGLCLFVEDRYEEAEQLLRKALAEEEQLAAGKEDESVTDSARRLLPHIHARLGEMAYMRGNDEEALMEYTHALQLNRFLPDILCSFQSLLQKQGIGAADQISLLQGLYNSREDVLFLGRSLTPKAGQVWLYYRKKAGITVDEADAFLIGAHFPAAVLEAGRAVVACRRVREWAGA